MIRRLHPIALLEGGGPSLIKRPLGSLPLPGHVSQGGVNSHGLRGVSPGGRIHGRLRLRHAEPHRRNHTCKGVNRGCNGRGNVDGSDRPAAFCAAKRPLRPTTTRRLERKNWGWSLRGTMFWREAGVFVGLAEHSHTAHWNPHKLLRERGEEH